MTLAFVHGHAAPAFNGLFYATAATVIPVLFIALAAQVRGYQDLLKALITKLRRGLDTSDRLVVLPITGIAILAAGTGGEIEAMLSLYRQRASAPAAVLLALVILTIAAAAAPSAALIQTVIRVAGEGGSQDASPKPPGDACAGADITSDKDAPCRTDAS